MIAPDARRRNVIMMSLLILAGIALTGMAFSNILDDEDQFDDPSDEGDPNSADPDTLMMFDDLEQDTPEAMYLSINQIEWESTYTSITSGELKDMSIDTDPVYVKDDPNSAETFDVSGFTNVIVNSSEGDIVVGGDGEGVPHRLISVSNGGSHILGGSGDDQYFSTGNGDTIDGGAGNDLLVSGTGSSDLNGGDGNDTLYSSYAEIFVSSGEEDIEDFVDGAPDYLSGGSGSDRIFASGEDTVETGQGADTITIFGPGGTVLDFDANEDRISVILSDEQARELNIDAFEFRTQGEFTTISMGAVDILTIPNFDNTTIAFMINDDDSLVDIKTGKPTHHAHIVILPWSNY